MMYQYDNGSWSRCLSDYIQCKAIFTTFHSYVTNEFLSLHFQRLVCQSAEYLGIVFPVSFQEFCELLQYFSLDEQVIKVIFTAECQLYVQPREFIKNSSQYCLETVVDELRTVQATIKDVNRTYYLEQLERSRQKGYSDVIYINDKGIVLETTIATIFWSDGSNLYTPKSTLPILSGTYAKAVKQWCQYLDIPVIECAWSMIKMKQSARQIWVCNAVIGWQVVEKLDSDWVSRPTQWTQTITQKIEQQEWKKTNGKETNRCTGN